MSLHRHAPIFSVFLPFPTSVVRAQLKARRTPLDKATHPQHIPDLPPANSGDLRLANPPHPATPPKALPELLSLKEKYGALLILEDPESRV